MFQQRRAFRFCKLKLKKTSPYIVYKVEVVLIIILEVCIYYSNNYILTFISPSTTGSATSKASNASGKFARPKPIRKCFRIDSMFSELVTGKFSPGRMSTPCCCTSRSVTTAKSTSAGKCIHIKPQQPPFGGVHENRSGYRPGRLRSGR